MMTLRFGASDKHKDCTEKQKGNKDIDITIKVPALICKVSRAGKMLLSAVVTFYWDENMLEQN